MVSFPPFALPISAASAAPWEDARISAVVFAVWFVVASNATELRRGDGDRGGGMGRHQAGVVATGPELGKWTTTTRAGRRRGARGGVRARRTRADATSRGLT